MVDSATVAPDVPDDNGAGPDTGRPTRRIADFWREFSSRAAVHLRHLRTTFLIVLLFLLIAIFALAPQIFINVPAGHVGVLWYRFFGGTVVDRSFGEGMHMIFPWDEMYIYDARLQNQARVYDTISSNGLSMEVDIAVRYRINREAVGMLHKLVGPDYPEILVYPEIGSHARELISRYTPEQLYTETRAFIQAEILERMVSELGSSLVNQSFQGRLVSVEDVLIRSVTLPERVADAIERKAEQYQIMLKYDFRLAREEKEKQRKKIEAEGIREFQDIVAKTITEEYLRLRGIEATMTLATSKNSKTIIIGDIVKKAVERGKRVMVLASRRDLIRQPFCRFVDLGIKPEQMNVVMAGTPDHVGQLTFMAGGLRPEDCKSDAELWSAFARRRPGAPVTIASRDTLLSWGVFPDVDIIIVDEAHESVGAGFQTILQRERKGEYLGRTVQVIPHVTDEIKRRMRLQATETPQPDVIITEIGGTVGDIESQPFIESARQIRHELGRKNVFFVHVSLVPFMGASGHVMWNIIAPKLNLRREDVWVTNALLCRPSKVTLENGVVIPEEHVKTMALHACQQRLIDELKVVDPVVTIPLGKWSLRALTFLPKAGIYQYRGSRMEIDYAALSTYLKSR